MVEGVGAAALRRALCRARWAEGPEWEIGLYISDVELSLYDHEYSPVSGVSLILDPDESLVVDVQTFMRDYPEDDPDLDLKMRRLLAPLLLRYRAEFVSLAVSDHYVTSPWLVEIRIRPSVRGRTVGDLLDLGQAIEDLVEAAEGHGPGLVRESVRDLLRGGRPDILLGQPEGPWLDVKQQCYDLASPHGKIALAQAVARFANAETGGLVVIGMSTKAVPGGEIIKAVTAVSADGVVVRRHAQVIADRLFPPPDLMTVEAVTLPTGGQLILIDVPPQPEELKPFLVHGAIVDGKVEGAFISIVRRRGEDSIPITGQAIHSTLAAGRALLRRGVLPDEGSA